MLIAVARLPLSVMPLLTLHSVAVCLAENEVPVEIADPYLAMTSVDVEVYVGDHLGVNVAEHDHAPHAVVLDADARSAGRQKVAPGTKLHIAYGPDRD